MDYVKDFGVDADATAKHLVTQAVDRGSQDNITIIIVFFEDGPLVTSCKSGIMRKLRRCVATCKARVALARHRSNK
mgnify:CR=1 FL=1